MKEVFQFGPFTLDPAERRLRAGSAPVALGSTAFGLLQILVERAGSVVSKDDLIAQVWGRPDVDENRLYVHVNALRKIVGRQCIVNVQGRGYRFDTPVQRNAASPPPSEPSPAPACGNLPASWIATDGAARLIGRAAQLRAVTQWLPHGRPLTLVGPGGVGKTRLAVHAASEAATGFPDGQWLVELAALANPALVPGAVAAALGLKVGHREQPLEALTRFLSRRRLLIVLDNCEHLAAACAPLCEGIAAAAPGVRVIATSRVPLGCSGERTHEVPPLELPPEGAVAVETLRATAAVELFAERAMAADGRFRMDDEDVRAAARLCRRLDGLPLAIEMVASWASALGLKALEAKLGAAPGHWLNARPTAPTRQSTLRSTMRWSHDLLEPAEQVVLRRLAVFPGDFSLRAAEAVASGDDLPETRVFEHLVGLVRKSMLTVETKAGAKVYRLLETTRAFARDMLESFQETERLRRRHAAHVLRLLETGIDALEVMSDAAWFAQYAPLLDDVRAALDWAMACDEQQAIALAGASLPIWRQLSLNVEGRQRLRAAIALLRPDTPPALEARLRMSFGEMLVTAATAKDAHEQISRAIALYRAEGETSRLALALARQAFTLQMLNRNEEAERVIDEAMGLLERSGLLRAHAIAYWAKACIEALNGRFVAAYAAGERAERLCQLAGADLAALGVATNLMAIASEMGELDRALSQGQGLAARLRATAHTDILGFVLFNLAVAWIQKGDFAQALESAREAAPLLRDEGVLCCLLDHLALVCALTGTHSHAALVAGFANAVYERSAVKRSPLEHATMERLEGLLCTAFSVEERDRLKREGALLTEDQVLQIALQD